MFTVGYCVGPLPAGTPSGQAGNGHASRRFTDDIRGPRVPWILFGAGAAGQLGVAATSGHLGYVGLTATPQATAAGYSQYLALLGECVPLAVAAAAVRAYRTRRQARGSTLAVLFAAAIVAGAVAGGKTSFVVAVLAVSDSAHHDPRPAPRRAARGRGRLLPARRHPLQPGLPGRRRAARSR